MALETSRSAIIRRLESEGWYLARRGAGHDIYRIEGVAQPIIVPRHRIVSNGVARQIAKAAGWTM